MNLVRRNRNEWPMAWMPRDMGEMIDRFFGDVFGSEQAAAWAPAMEVHEAQDALEVRAEVPGLSPEDLEISVQGNVLTLSGQKKQEHNEGDGGCIRSERRYGRFRRSITLPADVDAEKIEARQSNGVLTIRLPRSERAMPRRIEVQSN